MAHYSIEDPLAVGPPTPRTRPASCFPRSTPASKPRHPRQRRRRRFPDRRISLTCRSPIKELLQLALHEFGGAHLNPR
ncbi:hypothetical protein EJB05_50509, partial [Eragrostis curvula]